MQILLFLRKKHASLHWYIQRISALSLIPILLWIIIQGSILSSNTSDMISLIQRVIQDNVYLFILINIVLFSHIRTGVESIVDDYIHNEKTKFISYLSIRILTIQLIKYFYFLTIACL